MDSGCGRRHMMPFVRFPRWDGRIARPLPLVSAVIWAAGWLSTAQVLPVIGTLALALPCLGLSVLLARQSTRCLALLLVSVGILAGWRGLVFTPRMEAAASMAGTSQWMEGKVVSFPNSDRGAGYRESVTLRLDQGIRVCVFLPPHMIGYGDRVRVFATLSLPEPARSPGGFDEAAWMYGNNVMLSGHTAYSAHPTVIHQSSFMNPLRMAWCLRQWLYRSFVCQAGQRDADFLAAVLFGDTGGLDEELEDGFRRAGLAHVLSVSGSHLALAAAPVAMLLGSPGVGRRRQLAAQVLFMFLFAAMTGFRPAVGRALCMVLCARWGSVRGRRADGFSSLAGCVVLMILFSPSLARNVGFLVSVSATAGILLSGNGKPFAGRKGRLASAVRLSAYAQLATCPPLMSRIRSISLLAIPGWLLLLPMFTLLIPTSLVLGMSGIVGGSHIVAQIVHSWILVIRAVVMFAAQCGLSRWVVPFWTPFAWASVWLGLLSTGLHRRAPRMELACLSLVCMVIFGAQWGIVRARRPDLLVLFTDVGQGDCTLIQTAEGHSVLIDCGTPEAGDKVVVPMLDWMGIRRIDLCLITHGHADHAGGYDVVSDGVAIDRVGLSGADTESTDEEEDLSDKVVCTAREAGTDVIQLRSGDALQVGASTRLDILHPSSGDAPGNESSLVILVSCGAFRILVPGDAGCDSEWKMLRMGVLPDVDVLRVGHHGSESASGSGFLERIRPALSVVSVGNNRYGHPADETLERLAECGSTVYRTDRDGTVTLTIRGDKLTVGRALGG